MKIINKFRVSRGGDKTIIRNIKVDLQQMKVIDHPNIVKVYEFFEDDENFYVISEYCSGGLLLSSIIGSNSLSEKDVASIIYQLLSAVDHVHVRKLVHRDI